MRLPQAYLKRHSNKIGDCSRDRRDDGTSPRGHDEGSIFNESNTAHNPFGFIETEKRARARISAEEAILDFELVNHFFLHPGYVPTAALRRRDDLSWFTSEPHDLCLGHPVGYLPQGALPGFALRVLKRRSHLSQ
jgi:hypothetical protein